jgi:peptidoglycan/xylan/chitin deacetylase (PgdA/CDA1 family)
MMIIITYHAIGTENSPVSVTPQQFCSDLDGLRTAGFAFVSLDTCADWLAGASAIPDRAVAITFDDAYSSVATTAAPLLAQRGIPFVVFAIAGRTGGDNRWPGQWSSVRLMSLMDRTQLRDVLHAGGTIGAHSWSHPRLGQVDDDALLREIVEAGDRLAEIVDAPVQHYAYPYGERTLREIEIVSRRYLTGVSATPGIVRVRARVHDLPRLDCHDLRMALRFGILDADVLDPYLFVRRQLRRLRRQIERVSA